jgi:hypothetical protein
MCVSRSVYALCSMLPIDTLWCLRWLLTVQVTPKNVRIRKNPQMAKRR